MTENRNPESQRDLALNLISRRLSPMVPETLAVPEKPGWFDQFKAVLNATPLGGAVKAAMPVLHGLEWAGREGIRDPLSAAMSYASLSEADARAQRDGASWQQRALSGLREPVDWFNADRWGEARGTPGSVGQSVMTGALTSNIRDPAEVAAARESQWYRKGSGAVDAGLRLTVDPNAVLGGTTARIVGGHIARQGLPAVARSIRTAAGQNRLGLQSPGRWIGQVDPPDAPPGSFGVPGRTSTTPRFNTPQYLDEVRAARPETIARTATEVYPDSVRSARERVWQNAIEDRRPVLEDGGYIIPMRHYKAGDGTLFYPERGVLVQLDEAGQIVGDPIRAVGDRTPVNDPTIWSTLLGGPSKRKGWWWLHADSAQPSSPHGQIVGLDDLDTLAFKVAMTGDEVAASKVDDLLERFDSILPDDHWSTFQVPATMKGGVFKGTAAEGKTLTEIGEMVANGQELQLAQGARREAYGVLDLDRLRRNSLPSGEAGAMWPTIRRMYADEAVDNILTHRDDMDTMRLRALFYDDPSMAGDQTYKSAIRDYVNRLSERTGGGDIGLDAWLTRPHSRLGFPDENIPERMDQLRELIVADLHEITRKFADDVGMPERVSVGRWQSPGEPIGASGSTFPMDPQWGGQMTTGNPANPMSPIYGTSGPGGMGGLSGHKWIEAVVDPRKDIDFFMLSRTGQNMAEHEILMSPAKWAEKTVAGLADEPIPFSKEWDRIAAGGLGGRRTRDMPGLTSSQIEFGPNAPKWIQRALDELEAAGTEPDLLNRYLTAPAGRTREALANRVRAEINVGRRNVLEADGWTNLPTPGSLRILTRGVPGESGALINAGENVVWDSANGRHIPIVEKIASGKYGAADWFNFGMEAQMPNPPNWRTFTDELNSNLRRLLDPKSDTPGFETLVRLPDLRIALWQHVKSGRTEMGDIVGWTMRDGTKASMELLPGWKDAVRELVDRAERYGLPSTRSIM